MRAFRGVTLVLFAVVTTLVSPAATAADPDPAEAVARKFLQAITSNQTSDAYSLLAGSVREELTEEEFAATVVSFRVSLGPLRSLETEKASAIDDSCVRRVLLGTFEHVDTRFTFNLCRAGSTWNIEYFHTAAVRMDREPLARKIVTDRLAQAGAPEITRFECPKIDEAEVGQIVSCLVTLGKDCIVDAGMLMREDGFVFVSAEANAACDALLGGGG